MKPTALLCNILLFGAALLAGCDKATVLPPENEEQPLRTSTIAHLKMRCDGLRYHIVDQTIIRGTVTGNNRYGEFNDRLVIEDATGGITIAAEYDAETDGFPLGEELIVYCNGLTLYDYGGKIELGKVTAETTRIPRDEVAEHLRTSGREARFVTAKPVRIDLLTAAHVDTYVRIDGVRFTELAEWCDFDPETGRYVTTERTIEDEAGRTLAVRTAGTAHYASDPLPSGSGSLCGIVDYFNGSYMLRITGFETFLLTPPAAPATAYP